MLVLGIDVGTTHTKVLALDTERGTTVALEAGPTPMRKDETGDAHAAGDVLDAVIESIAALVRRLDRADAIKALCVASVGEEVVLLDQRDRPVGDTIAWYDPRGLDQARTFSSGAGADLALSRRWPPDATFSLFKLMWLRDHRAAEFDRAVRWTDLGDYVLAGLGGEVVMDWSHASRAGAFDLAARAWDHASIEAARLAIEFPRLVSSRAVIGTVTAAVAERTQLPSDVAIVSGGHDHLCAAYGAGVRSGAELFISAGTSEAHLALLRAPLEGEAGRSVDQGCFVDADSYYAHINIHSGHFYQQWRSLLYGRTSDDVLYDEVAAVPPGAHGVRFDLADELREGRFDHVPYDADRSTIMRALLEGLARRSARAVDALERASGSPYDVILVAGHPTRLALWKELRMAAYDRPMAAVVEPESAAYGAAVMAAQAAKAPGADALVAAREPWNGGFVNQRR